MNMLNYARPHNGHTTPHRCASERNQNRNQPSQRDQQARCRLQDRASDFHTEFHGPVFISIRSEAKRDIYNNLDLDKSISIHLDPPSTEKPCLIEV